MEKKSSIKDFQELAKLGEGAFGQVFKVKRKADGNIYALKKVKLGSMKQKERDNALNEIRILASYQGQNIIGYKEAFFDDNLKLLCIVMQFAEGGDILKKVQTHQKKRTKFTEEEIWKAIVHMAQGLKQLHDRKVLHRDLKCANVFITSEGIYKLGDLNVSKVLKMDMAYTQTGTPYYASPEVWKDKPYGSKSDIWSLGCVAYEMAALKPPFTAVDLQGLYRKITAGHFSRIPANYSNELEGVIRSMLKLSPRQRPSVDELLQNQTVRNHYKDSITVVPKKSGSQQLLKTIKYDPRNIKALGAKLPKAKYEEQQAQNYQEQKMEQLIKKQREIEEKERIKVLNSIEEEKQELVKKRQRVLSACGVRKNSISDSPAKPINKAPVLENNKKNQLPKLPPRPNYQPSNGYKLPPKPINYNNRSNENSRINQSRNNSKQNLRKAGENIISSRGNIPSQQKVRQRCSSAKKVIYPVWW